MLLNTTSKQFVFDQGFWGEVYFLVVLDCWYNFWYDDVSLDKEIIQLLQNNKHKQISLLGVLVGFHSNVAEHFVLSIKKKNSSGWYLVVIKDFIKRARERNKSF
jgi:hypothetical protein